MRANAIMLFCKIAVVTKNLKPRWIFIHSKPNIDMISCSTGYLSMFCAVIIYMVNTQKWFIVKATASTFPSISHKCLMSCLPSMPQLDFFMCLWILFLPLWSIFLLIGNQSFSIIFIILLIVCGLSFLDWNGRFSVLMATLGRAKVMLAFFNFIRILWDGFSALFTIYINHTVCLP